MKATTALFLLSAVSSSNVLLITASANNADELNFNLRHTANIKLLEGAQNKHQCYNHCQRHTGKSNQWIKNCEERCDRQYDPPTPAPTELQCYNLGDECETDDDCLTGGFNPCNKCGTTKGTEYYNRCYAEPVETPAPTTAPSELQCYNLGDECITDDDCMTGGFNPCNKCGKTRGTEYYQRCYSDETPAPTPEPTPSPTELQCYNLGDECDTDEDCMTGGFNPCTKCGTTRGTLYFGRCYGEDDEDVVLIGSDEDEDKVDWEKAGNWTRKAADTVADGTKKAAQKTADGTKKAAEATKDWGKRTFTDDNSSSIKSSSMVIVAGVAFAMLV